MSVEALERPAPGRRNMVTKEKLCSGSEDGRGQVTGKVGSDVRHYRGVKAKQRKIQALTFGRYHAKPEARDQAAIR